MPLADPLFEAFDETRTIDDFMVRNRNLPGIYVIRTNAEENVFRFGRSENCVGSRIRHHGGPNGAFDNISGDLMPYEPCSAWALCDWPADRVGMAELILFGALRSQGAMPFYSAHRNRTDKSNFRLPQGFDWEAFHHRVQIELDTIAALGD